MWDGVFIGSANWRCLGSLVFHNPAKERVRDCAVQDGPPDYKTWRADEAKDIGERSCSVQLFLHLCRSHVFGQPIDVEADIRRHPEDGGFFGDQRCSHESTPKFWLFALLRGSDRRPRGKLGSGPEDRKFMLNQPEGCRIIGHQRVEVSLQCPAVGTAELAEIGNGNDPLRTAVAKEGRAGVSTYRFGTRAALVCILRRRIESDKGQRCSGGLANPVKSAKRRQIRNVCKARPAAREPVPGKSPQTIDHGNDPSEDQKVAASHGHTTVTGVPTGTCS
jgi:hypothetical protein